MATITSPRAHSPSSASMSGTPRIAPSTGSASSSVRPSIELNREKAGSPAIPQTTTGSGTARRNRAALRDYYNLKAKPTPLNTGSPRTGSVASTSASVTSSPTGGSPTSSIAPSTITTSPTGTGTSSLTAQLDNPQFDAESYLSTLLSTKSLKEILRTEAVLVSEIRNLDGDRKALVYDNYSKLIAAVGTLGEISRALNANTGPNSGFPTTNLGLGLGPRSSVSSNSNPGLNNMQVLVEKMDNLSTTLKDITREVSAEQQGNDEAAATERQARRQARQEKKQRDLVRRVMGAPSRLSELLQEGKRDDVEKEWTEVKRYLDTWEQKNVKGVKEVRKACEEVMDDGEESQDDESGSGSGSEDN